MQRVRNIAFVAVTAFVLCSVIGFNALFMAGVRFPEWLAIGNGRSDIEGKLYAEPPDLASDSFLDGEFQDKAEKCLADLVPMRDVALLANAAWQRGCIAVANTPFGFEAYPSRFESGNVVVPSLGKVLVRASSASEKSAKVAKQVAISVNKAAEGNPHIRFVFDLLTDTWTSDVNPSHSLISNPLDHEWATKNLLSRLGSQVMIVDEGIKDEDELISQWFNSEHHWKMPRMVASYNKIGALLGWIQVKYENDVEVDGEWKGSTARGGLDLDYADTLRDLPTDFSSLAYSVDGKPVDRGNRDRFMRGEEVKLAYFNAYHSYFGYNVSEGVWENHAEGAMGTCLFVAQSYGVPMEPYIASNYKKTVCVDPVNKAAAKTLSELINEYKPDDVVIQFGYAQLQKLAYNSPEFFS